MFPQRFLLSLFFFVVGRILMWESANFTSRQQFFIIPRFFFMIYSHAPPFVDEEVCIIRGAQTRCLPKTCKPRRGQIEGAGNVYVGFIGLLASDHCLAVAWHLKGSLHWSGDFPEKETYNTFSVLLPDPLLSYFIHHSYKIWAGATPLSSGHQ